MLFLLERIRREVPFGFKPMKHPNRSNSKWPMSHLGMISRHLRLLVHLAVSKRMNIVEEHLVVLRVSKYLRGTVYFPDKLKFSLSPDLLFFCGSISASVGRKRRAPSTANVDKLLQEFLEQHEGAPGRTAEPVRRLPPGAPSSWVAASSRAKRRSGGQGKRQSKAGQTPQQAVVPITDQDREKFQGYLSQLQAHHHLMVSMGNLYFPSICSHFSLINPFFHHVQKPRNIRYMQHLRYALPPLLAFNDGFILLRSSTRLSDALLCGGLLNQEKSSWMMQGHLLPSSAR